MDRQKEGFLLMVNCFFFFKIPRQTSTLKPETRGGGVLHRAFAALCCAKFTFFQSHPPHSEGFSADSSSSAVDGESNVSFHKVLSLKFNNSILTPCLTAS